MGDQVLPEHFSIHVKQCARNDRNFSENSFCTTTMLLHTLSTLHGHFLKKKKKKCIYIYISSCSTPTLQPCCLSSRIPGVPLKRCWFVSIEEVQGKTTQHVPKITLKSQYRMLGKTGTPFESLYYCRRGVHQRQCLIKFM